MSYLQHVPGAPLNAYIDDLYYSTPVLRAVAQWIGRRWDRAC